MLRKLAKIKGLMPRRSAAIGVDLAEVHTRLISAAIKLFSTSSLSGVTLQTLCAEARCTKHDYYKLFQSMDKVYLEAVNEVVERQNTSFDRFVSAMHKQDLSPSRTIERLGRWIEDLPELDASFLVQVYLADLRSARTAVAGFFDRLSVAIENALKDQRTPRPSEEARDLVRILLWSKVFEKPTETEALRKTFKRWLGRLSS